MVQQGGHQERLSLQHGTYVGDVSNGKPHGAGTMTFKEDDAAERKTYEGAWLDGKRTGHGCMTWRNGEVSCRWPNRLSQRKWKCFEPPHCKPFPVLNPNGPG